MKRNLLLLICIPLIFIIGIFAWETKNALWLGLYVPFFVVRYLINRELAKKSIAIIPQRYRPDIIDKNHESQQTKN